MTTDTALLMLDYQVALAQEGDLCLAPPLAAQVRERDVIATAATVLAAARAAGIPVIHVRLAFEPTYRLRTNRLPRFDVYPTNEKMRAGSPEAELVARARSRRGRTRRGQGRSQRVHRHTAPRGAGRRGHHARRPRGRRARTSSSSRRLATPPTPAFR